MTVVFLIIAGALALTALLVQSLFWPDVVATWRDWRYRIVHGKPPARPTR